MFGTLKTAEGCVLMSRSEEIKDGTARPGVKSFGCRHPVSHWQFVTHQLMALAARLPVSASFEAVCLNVK